MHTTIVHFAQRQTSVSGNLARIGLDSCKCKCTLPRETNASETVEKRPTIFRYLFFSPATYTVAEKNNPSGQSASLPLCNFAFLRLSMIWSIANRARCKSLQIHIDSGTLLWWDKCSGIPGKKLHRQIWAKFFQQWQKQILQNCHLGFISRKPLTDVALLLLRPQGSIKPTGI